MRRTTRSSRTGQSAAWVAAAAGTRIVDASEVIRRSETPDGSLVRPDDRCEAVALGIGTGNALFAFLVGGIMLSFFWLGLVVMRRVPPFR
jgi:hypothetical protein